MQPIQTKPPPPPRPEQRLALIGLPPALIEPVTMLAEIMGWDVVTLAGGPVMRPPVRLCLAVLPGTQDDPSPLAAWSPDTNLNEHISRLGLSRLDHPPCLTRLELLLQLGAIQSAGSGRGEDHAFQSEHPRGADAADVGFGGSAAHAGANGARSGDRSAAHQSAIQPGAGKRDAWP